MHRYRPGPLGTRPEQAPWAHLQRHDRDRAAPYGRIDRAYRHHRARPHPLLTPGLVMLALLALAVLLVRIALNFMQALG